jgi:putative ABC transport system permease protein
MKQLFSRIALVWPELKMGLDSLTAHKLRSLLTMLGMIFGVGAVISMLSIGAGARQEALSFIELLGVNNIIVEAKESSNFEELQKVRKLSPGLTFKDVRALQNNLPQVELVSARKRFKPGKIFPAESQDLPRVFGVMPEFLEIASLRLVAGRFFDAEEQAGGVPVAVLGESAKRALFGYRVAVGRYIKVNDLWLRVIGVLNSQTTYQTEVEGVQVEDRNHLIYVPLNTCLYRMSDSQSFYKDEIDGIYLKVRDSAQSVATSDAVRAILNATHRAAGDFSVIVPAGLLEEQRRTQLIFNFVMVAIAGISLLVGGIGIMNIMLATVLERTHEIGIRRAIGARRRDIVRQFLMEAVLISIVGGLLGIGFGFSLSRLIAWTAGWSTIVSPASIFLAFSVSVSVGLIFGLYPARKAALLDPIEAIRYE